MGDFDRNFSRGRSGRGRSDRNRPSFGGRDRGSDRGRGRDRDRDRGRGRDRRSERPEMHPVTCDKCGKDCEVPFRPTQGKPIFCDDCFKDKSREAGSRSEMGKPINNEKFDQINKKLDKILNILEEKPVEKKKPEVKKPKNKEKEEPELEYAKSIEKKKPKKKAKKTKN